MTTSTSAISFKSPPPYRSKLIAADLETIRERNDVVRITPLREGKRNTLL